MRDSILITDLAEVESPESDKDGEVDEKAKWAAAARARAGKRERRPSRAMIENVLLQ